MRTTENPKTSRLDAVEIKVTVGARSVDHAVEVFGLDPARGRARGIFFCESTGSDGAGTPLLDQGVILRLRDTAGDGGDSTVKFRPFDARRLTGHWVDAREVDGATVRVEADWVAQRHVVAASVVSDQDPGEVADAAGGRRRLNRLFSRPQEDFLATYATGRIDLDELRVLGPIQATKWEAKHVGIPQDVAAEQWVVDRLMFLELSIRVEDPGAAGTAQARFEELLRDHALLGDAVQETKTRTVLEYLARRG